MHSISAIMAELVDAIIQEVVKAIPDAVPQKARELAEYLTSEAIGVREVKSLYDLTVEDIAAHFPKCDANRLHRLWQQKFSK